MLITTTDTVEGHKIVEYQGLVMGDAVLGANVFRDFFSSIRDIVGGRSAAYEKELSRAREIALAEMVEKGRSRGANAVIAVDIDYEAIGSGGSMLMVTAAGTAVRLERDHT